MLLLAAFFVFSSCKDDDDDNDNTSVKEGKMITKVNDNSVDFNVTAISYTATDEGKTYEYITITGVTGTTGTNGLTSFVITVYGEDVKNATYIIPAVENSEDYDYFKGYATGYYFTSSDSASYIPNFAQNNVGSVTIEEISSSMIKGKFDMVLTSTKDDTKTIKLSGNFNAKIISVNVVDGN